MSDSYTVSSLEELFQAVQDKFREAAPDEIAVVGEGDPVVYPTAN